MEVEQAKRVQGQVKKWEQRRIEKMQEHQISLYDKKLYVSCADPQSGADLQLYYAMISCEQIFYDKCFLNSNI